MLELGKIVVGLSGGVDSAVAALLLQRQGYDVRAVFMKNWSEDDFGGPCPWAEDQASAKAVADYLHLPLVTWNFEREYRERVFQVMLHEYERGRTPNPDILCNQVIKFDLFLNQALTRAPLIATGHYARTKDGRLYKAADRDKDQSYFLAGITSQALAKTVFPLGELTKTEVRKIAKDAGLPNWDRPDSVGICFIGEKKMHEFLAKHIAASAGDIILLSGVVIGRHDGLPFYTVGQRHGFGHLLDQQKVAKEIGAGKPLFIKDKDVDRNVMVVAPTDQPEILTATEFTLTDVSWINQQVSWPWSGAAKLRYRQNDVDVTVTYAEHRLTVSCREPQRAITPGQYAVFYTDDECLGCGVIDRILST